MPIQSRAAHRIDPRRLIACAIAAVLASAATCAAQDKQERRGARGAPATCALEIVASGTVRSVTDARTFVLADGREVRLAGIEVPLPRRGEAVASAAATATDAPKTPADDPAAAALAALHALLLGRDVALRHSKLVTDRYGRTVADATITGTDTASVAKAMIAQGFAWFAPGAAGTAACVAELRAAERTASAAKLGLWGDPRYFPMQANNPAGIAAERGSFKLVEGKVVSVRERGGTIYVNFDRRWRAKVSPLRF